MTTTTHLVKYEDLNHHGTLFAGRASAWLVEESFIAAAKLVGKPESVVCAQVTHISFKQPINRGDLLTIKAEIGNIGTKSITIFTQAYTQEDQPAVISCEAIFVTVDEKGVAYAHGINKEQEAQRVVNLPMIDPFLIPYDSTDWRHTLALYHTRSDPKVYPTLIGPPPTDMSSHLEYLRTLRLHGRRSFYMISQGTFFVGYCHISPLSPEYRQVELGWAVAGAFQGKGIGTKAVKLLIAEAKEKYPNNDLVLFVKDTNTKAISLYKKVGFEEIKTTDNIIKMILKETDK